MKTLTVKRSEEILDCRVFGVVGHVGECDERREHTRQLQKRLERLGVTRVIMQTPEGNVYSLPLEESGSLGNKSVREDELIGFTLR